MLELGPRYGPAQTEPGYPGLIRAEIRTSPDRDSDHKVQADNIKRWGSISRPPPERLGMSGWERLSAEGRSKRLKIWSPGLPISNPTSCNYYPPEPGAESIGNRLFRPLRPNVEPVPIRGTNPYFCAPQRCRRLECFDVGLRFFLRRTSPRAPINLLTSLNGA